jgi:hypothetical protein
VKFTKPPAPVENCMQFSLQPFPNSFSLMRH